MMRSQAGVRKKTDSFTLCERGECFWLGKRADPLSWKKGVLTQEKRPWKAIEKGPFLNEKCPDRIHHGGGQPGLELKARGF